MTHHLCQFSALQQRPLTATLLEVVLIQPEGNCVLELSCEVEIPALLLVVGTCADLQRVVVPIGVLTGCLDIINM